MSRGEPTITLKILSNRILTHGNSLRSNITSSKTHQTFNNYLIKFRYNYSFILKLAFYIHIYIFLKFCLSYIF